MASQSTPTTKTRITFPKKLALIHNVSPGMVLSTGILADSKVSTIDKSEKTLSPRANQLLQLKEVSKIMSESSVDIKVMSGFNSPELSIVRMLDQGKNENCIETNLREEVAWLKRELATKSTFIEKLMKENEKLRKEMDDLLSTVEDAKDKINLKLLGCQQRIQQLESENKQYQDQLQKVYNEENAHKNSLKGMENQVGKYYTNVQERMETFYQKVNSQVAGMTGFRDQNHTPNKPTQSQPKEKESHLKISIRQGSPTPFKSRFSTPKSGNILPQSVIKRPFGTPTNSTTSLTSLGRSGAENHVNRKMRTITLQHLNEFVPINNSENNCVLGALEVSGVRRTPKANFTPKSKIKLAFHTDGFDFGEDT